MRPVWLLDVDGVVNTFCKPEEHPWRDHGPLESKGVHGLGWSKPFPFLWSPVLVFAIFSLVDKYDVDLQLASAWNCDPDGLFDKVFQREFPTAFDAIGPWDALSKKTAAAERVAQTGCPVVWTDDDAIPHGFRNRFPNVFTVSPDEDYGLTPGHMTEIEAFLAMNTD